MDKSKFLQILVVLLVLLNLVTIAFSVGPRMFGPKQGVKRHFGFDKVQVESFEMSRGTIQEKLDELSPRLMEVSQKYYALEAKDSSKRAELLAQITTINEDVYKAHFQHFQEIREICTPEQEEKLPEFIAKLMNRGEPKKPPRR